MAIGVSIRKNSGLLVTIFDGYIVEALTASRAYTRVSEGASIESRRSTLAPVPA